MGVAALLLGAGAPGFAQQESLPNTHPVPIVEGQSAAPAAPPGGTTEAGVGSPGEAPPPSSGPLGPGPAAGDERAQYLSNGTLIAGGVAITAAVVCALACFSNSSSTTTSTTVVHH
jgi:hypothetical protein